MASSKMCVWMKFKSCSPCQAPSLQPITYLTYISYRRAEELFITFFRRAKPFSLARHAWMIITSTRTGRFSIGEYLRRKDVPYLQKQVVHDCKTPQQSDIRSLAITLADHRQLDPSIFQQVEGVLKPYARIHSSVLLSTRSVTVQKQVNLRD